VANYITQNQLQSAADAIVRPSPSQPYASWYVLALANALVRSSGLIRRTLAGRGYSPTLIAAWTDGAEFQLDLSLFFIGVDARNDLKPEALAMLEKYDRREELSKVFFTDSVGNFIPPDAAGTGNPVGTGLIHGAPRVCTPPGLFGQRRNGYWGGNGDWNQGE